jgi:hypothetical protein
MQFNRQLIRQAKSVIDRASSEQSEALRGKF